MKTISITHEGVKAMRKMLAGLVVILSLAEIEPAIAQSEGPVQSGAVNLISAGAKRDETKNDTPAGAGEPENATYGVGGGNEKKSNCDRKDQINSATPGDQKAPPTNNSKKDRSPKYDPLETTLQLYN